MQRRVLCGVLSCRCMQHPHPRPPGGTHGTWATYAGCVLEVGVGVCHKGVGGVCRCATGCVGGRGGGGGSKDCQTTPATTGTTPSTPTTGPCYRGHDTTRNSGRSGRQKALTRRSTRREEWVAVQGPVKKLQPDGMWHRGGGGAYMCVCVGGGCMCVWGWYVCIRVPE